MSHVARVREPSSFGILASALLVLRVPAWIGASYALLKTTADPDLWGHVRFGMDILTSRSIPSVDPYSFTSDLPWLNHEWLSELIMGAAYRSSGSAGLVTLKIAVTVATFVLLTPTLKHAPLLWRWPSALLAVLGILPIALAVRPQLWTLLLLTLECQILNSNPRQRSWLPFMFALWVNLHGGWIVGFGVLVMWSLIEFVHHETSRPSMWIVLGIPLACALATLANPYGWRMWAFLANTVGLARANIVEWQPVWRDSLSSVALWLIAVGWAGLAVRRAHSWRPRALMVVSVLAFVSLLVNRLLPLFIPAAVVFLLPHVKSASQKDPRPWPRGRTIVDVLFVCIGALVLAWPASAGCIQMRGSWLPDVSAARALAAAHPAGRMITWFDWGEYAIWHFGPAVKVSIDGRRETVYSERMLQEQTAIAFGEPAGLKALERYSPEYVWLPILRSDRTRAWLQTHNYRIDVETGHSFVAVRRNLARVIPAPPPLSSAGCFPGI